VTATGTPAFQVPAVRPSAAGSGFLRLRAEKPMADDGGCLRLAGGGWENPEQGRGRGFM